MQTILLSLKVRLREVKWLAQGLAARRRHQTLVTTGSFFPSATQRRPKASPLQIFLTDVP